jgi:hypothetical protein
MHRSDISLGHSGAAATHRSHIMRATGLVHLILLWFEIFALLGCYAAKIGS